jgi:trigger factor
VRSLEARGIDLATYLQLTGSTPQALEQRLRAETERAVARELVLEAVADKLAIEVSDDEIRSELREHGESDDDIEAFIADGGADRARHELRLNKAIDRVAAEVKPISQEEAEERAGKQAVRDKIWTPEKDSPTEEKKIWTPGSKE